VGSDEPGPRSWIPYAVVAVGAAGALWLALLPLEGLPPPPGPMESPPAAALEADSPPPAEEPAPASSAAEPAEPPTPAPPAPAPRLAPGSDPSRSLGEASAEFETEEARGPDTDLGRSIGRQLAMNDLVDVRVEVERDRVVTSGALPRASDRERLALIVRSLAPALRHEDRTVVAPRTRSIP
jgi:hypothetical protein